MELSCPTRSRPSAEPVPRSRIRAWLSIVVVTGLALAACGGEASPPIAGGDPDEGNSTVESSETDGPPTNLNFDDGTTVLVPNTPGTITTTGVQRVMTALLSPSSNRFLGGPDLPVTVVFEAVDSDDRGEAEGTWLITDASALGLYVSHFEFPSAGLWEIIVSSEGTEVARTLYEVTDESPSPTIGDRAPATDTPTAETAEEIAAISTDPEPSPNLYRLSVADAVANGKPTVVAFVTPAFCQTALCGPTIDVVKSVAGGDGVDVVHVEPFDLTQAPGGILEPIEAMDDWGLQTEPWVFVIDGDGVVTATFEGIIGPEELQAAVDEVS